MPVQHGDVLINSLTCSLSLSWMEEAPWLTTSVAAESYVKGPAVAGAAAAAASSGEESSAPYPPVVRTGGVARPERKWPPMAVVTV